MIDVPVRYHCNTGGEGTAYDLMEEFFENVRREINEPTNRPTRFTRRIGNHEQSDDKTHLLLYADRVVATVTETRDMGNYVDFAFFYNLEGVLE